jgi:predicted ester cyclase
MSAEDNKRTVTDFFAAFDRHELDKLPGLVTPDFVAHIAGAPGPLDIAGFVQFGGVFLAAIPDGHHRFEDVVAEGDKVVTRGYFEGTHKGELMGIPATGKSISLGVIHIDRLAGSKIAEHHGIGDLMGLMQQLGAMPAPG